jgi:hypothetical protein
METSCGQKGGEAGDQQSKTRLLSEIRTATISSAIDTPDKAWKNAAILAFACRDRADQEKGKKKKRKRTKATAQNKL